MPATAEIRRAADRAVTTTSWLKSRHSFSFGDHYDPDNTHHGLLLVNNDDIVAPDSGFDTHPHRDMEIVTWVLEGELTHQDSAGNRGVIYPGLAQRMSAGSGILHSEKNDSSTAASAFRPDVGESRRDRYPHPATNSTRSTTDCLAAALVTIASGIPGREAAITLHNSDAALHRRAAASRRHGRPARGPVPAPFVARGRVTCEGVGELDAGDAVRFTDADGRG